ncbi:nuaf-3 [Pristionchus pacificus]|uniref:NADH dehydrogenase [ubiquinone] 1 alpha subcomplex assembly factor 3 n=1 Tax=Pristionchus pacificus TaxID=54126 RepID=A0A454XK11_PRIPA|nr:nuaf-3 [Pristionchus pacificus]|eukprot:PDM65505.1 nuaf-3 [Pristionchus pacificus]
MWSRSLQRVLHGGGRRMQQLQQQTERRMAGPSKGDTGVLDSFHLNPMGDSDMPQRSRVSFLSDEMKEAKQMGVRGLSSYGFRMIDGSFLYGPIALFPKTALSWRVRTPDDITEESLCLFAALEPKIDILVLGVGDKKNIDKVRARVFRFLQEHKIGLEISDTEDALATFNFLNAEGRYVAAALYPPDEMTITDAEYGRAMCLLKNWDEMEENPLFTGLNSSDYGYDDLVKKLWGGNASWDEVKRALAPPDEEKKDWKQIGAGKEIGDK